MTCTAPRPISLENHKKKAQVWGPNVPKWLSAVKTHAALLEMRMALVWPHSTKKMKMKQRSDHMIKSLQLTEWGRAENKNIWLLDRTHGTRAKYFSSHSVKKFIICTTHGRLFGLTSLSLTPLKNPYFKNSVFETTFPWNFQWPIPWGEYRPRP